VKADGAGPRLPTSLGGRNQAHTAVYVADTDGRGAAFARATKTRGSYPDRSAGGGTRAGRDALAPGGSRFI